MTLPKAARRAIYHTVGILSAGIILTSCKYCSFYEDDNPVEEYLEDLLEDETGIHIDFTGESKEA